MLHPFSLDWPNARGLSAGGVENLSAAPPALSHIVTEIKPQRRWQSLPEITRKQAETKALQKRLLPGEQCILPDEQGQQRLDWPLTLAGKFPSAIRTTDYFYGGRSLWC